jgi:hypothetical protein
VTELVDISHSLNFDPTPLHGGGTNIYAGLEHAHEIAKSFLAQEKSGDVPHTVRIVVLTDGECSDPMRTIQIANRIKADDPSIKIWSSFFDSKGFDNRAGESLMKNICSDAESFMRVANATEIRGFFNKSISK